MRLAIIGHVEHVTVGRVPALPGAGDIAHLETPRWLPGGGGGIAFFQLIRSPAEVHLFTALGDDEAAGAVEQRLRATPARLHLAPRATAHTRDLVMVTPDGERTIVVVGEPLHPQRNDPLPGRSSARATPPTSPPRIPRP
jgi:ribokinase